mmetsp:Transcript_1168/g.983  ORF Transcript_1168/g.983 Transcript_1168/m.983 type:complete len:120 (-) Transcript_1168:73-432(-)
MRKANTRVVSSLNRVLRTVAFIVFCVSISVGVENLGYTYSFMSIVSANTLVFIFPTLLYCRIFYEAEVGEDKYVKSTNVSFRSLLKQTATWYMSVGLFIFGVLMFPLCLSGLIHTMVNA